MLPSCCSFFPPTLRQLWPKLNPSMPYTDEDYFVPLEDQRVFGAGIRRKRVPFVRSSEHELNTTVTANAQPTSTTAASAGVNIANRYLSIVLPKDQPKLEQKQEQNEQVHPAPPSPSSMTTPQLLQRCEICNLPLTSDSNTMGSHRPHEASLAHQLCLAHSHPPSHLDRTRHGLRYLSAYGWDPDSRLGLGAPGREGIREPVKPRVKHDTIGLGVNIDEDADEGPVSKRSRNKEPPKPTKVEKLNAKQVRKSHAEAKKKNEKLRELFFRSDDVQKHLGLS